MVFYKINIVYSINENTDNMGFWHVNQKNLQQSNNYLNKQVSHTLNSNPLNSFIKITTYSSNR